MSEPQNARQLLESAEQAAIKGDFSTADELLSGAARMQEAELGPLHPDLANTLNSLAIVAERTGRFGDAEAFYRRSAAIASASLPADHPIVAESRKNLEDFCRERGLPIVAAIIPRSGQESAGGLDAFASEIAPGTTGKPTSERTVDAGVGSQGKPPSSGKSSPATLTPQRPLSRPLSAPRRPSYRLAWMPIAAIALVAAAMLVRQPSPSSSDSTTPATSQATEPAPPPAIPAPSEPALPPKIVPQADAPAVAPDKPPSSEPSPSDISLTIAQLCQSFSTSGGEWRCNPPGDSVTPGSIVFYTRVRSSRDAEVVHRWYRDDMLRQAVTLTIRANASEGYRTYSRHTVDAVGDWRVEVRSADGSLLHEQRFAVR